MFTRFFGAVGKNLAAAAPVCKPVPHDRQHLVAVMEPLSLVGGWHFVPLDQRYQTTYLTWPPPEEKDTYNPGQPEADTARAADGASAATQTTEKVEKKSAQKL